MSTKQDFIQLTCSQDLIQAGIIYVTRSLVQPGGRGVSRELEGFRLGVVDKAIELAFRRLLVDEHIPHQLVEPVSFSQPDTFDLSFGGRRCAVFGQLVSKRGDINKLHKDPGRLEKEKVYIRESARPSSLRDVDIYVFAVLTGLVTRGRQELQKAVTASQPVHLVYPMPEKWSAPAQWEYLGQLALKGDISEPLSVTLYGQDKRRGFVQETVELPSRERVQVEGDFHTLNLLHVSALPDGPLGVHSPTLGETHLASPYQWGNVWVYGIRITLVGYISQGDFNRKAEKLGVGSRVLGIPRLEEGALAAPVAELKPMKDLFVRAENWARGRKTAN